MEESSARRLRKGLEDGRAVVLRVMSGGVSPVLFVGNDAATEGAIEGTEGSMLLAAGAGDGFVGVEGTLGGGGTLTA